MQYHIEGNGVLEGTPQEVASVIRLLEGRTEVVATRVHRKHKRHMHTKVCDRCGNAYKGNLGLAIHKSKCIAPLQAEAILV